MRYNPVGNTGIMLSELGFGASPLGDMYHQTFSQNMANDCIAYAIDHGITYFDVAPYYGLGLAEERLGKALAPYKEKAIISTKVGRYGVAEFDFSAARVASSIKTSLTRFSRDYLDIIFCHDIEFTRKATLINETLPALQTLKEQGLIKTIGISGHPLPTLLELAEDPRVDIVLSYNHYHLLDQSLKKAIPQFKANNVTVINASIFSMGLLTQAGPRDWHPAPQSTQNQAVTLKHDLLKQGKDLEKTAFEFALSCKNVASTLVGMGALSDLKSCLDWMQKIKR